MNFTSIKAIYCAYALCTLHAIAYTKPTLLEILLPCCFKSQPKSPTEKKEHLLDTEMQERPVRSGSLSSFLPYQSPSTQETNVNTSDNRDQELFRLSPPLSSLRQKSPLEQKIMPRQEHLLGTQMQEEHAQSSSLWSFSPDQNSQLPLAQETNANISENDNQEPFKLSSSRLESTRHLVAPPPSLQELLRQESISPQRSNKGLSNKSSQNSFVMVDSDDL